MLGLFKLQFNEERPEPMMTDRYETPKPEIQKVLRSLAAQLRHALPIGAFSERERVALALANELVRGVLEQDLQDTATVSRTSWNTKARRTDGICGETHGTHPCAGQARWLDILTGLSACTTAPQSPLLSLKPASLKAQHRN